MKPSKIRRHPRNLLTQRRVEHLRAFALVELNLSEGEFNQLTPADWTLIFAQWKRKQLREDARVARICQAIFGSVGMKVPLRTFLPDPPPEPKQTKREKAKKRRHAPLPPAEVIERQFLALFPVSAKLEPAYGR